VVGELIQRLPVPTKTHYIGEGKLVELTALKSSTGYNVVIFDDELSPLQQRNLEDALQVKVIDRVTLILDIFARRARTREGQLQVELAQHQYLYPRLAGQWSHLERLGGGIGTRGPGESQLETDRRIIQKKIHRLKQQIEQVRKQRLLYRQKRKRSGIPVVALVGYTNAGKSNLLNSLSRAEVLTDDKLFATLDPTTRRLVLPDKTAVLMTDTVGFIRKLPPTIVTAFRATLEELAEAAILVHVVDLSSPDAPEQCQAVEDILNNLELADKPRITALNKIDLLLDRSRAWSEEEAVDYLSDQPTPTKTDTVLVSANKKWGLTHLLELISQILSRTGTFS
jgi:GTP-binding protein HflX